jgi:hypothetical protein
MGCAGFGWLVGDGVGLPSSFLGWHQGDAVSVLADRGGQSGRVSGRIVSGLAVSVGGSNIGGGKHLTFVSECAHNLGVNSCGFSRLRSVIR